MDADRLAVVSDEASPIGEDNTLVLAALYVLGKSPGPVVTNLSTTGAMRVIAERFNCPFYLSKIGEAHVTEQMQRTGAVIGGEGNGGVIYPLINFARDSLVAARDRDHDAAFVLTMDDLNGNQATYDAFVQAMGNRVCSAGIDQEIPVDA